MTPVGRTVYSALFRARVTVSTMSVVFMRFWQDNRRWNQLRSLVLAWRPVRGSTRWRRHSSGWLLWSTSVTVGRRWLSDIGGRWVSRQNAAVTGGAVLVMTRSAVADHRTTTSVVFSSTADHRARTTTSTWTLRPSTKSTISLINILTANQSQHNNFNKCKTLAWFSSLLIFSPENHSTSACFIT